MVGSSASPFRQPCCTSNVDHWYLKRELEPLEVLISLIFLANEDVIVITLVKFQRWWSRGRLRVFLFYFGIFFPETFILFFISFFIYFLRFFLSRFFLYLEFFSLRFLPLVFFLSMIFSCDVFLSILFYISISYIYRLFFVYSSTYFYGVSPLIFISQSPNLLSSLY